MVMARPWSCPCAPSFFHSLMRCVWIPAPVSIVHGSRVLGDLGDLLHVVVELDMSDDGKIMLYHPPWYICSHHIFFQCFGKECHFQDSFIHGTHSAHLLDSYINKDAWPPWIQIAFWFCLDHAWVGLTYILDILSFSHCEAKLVFTWWTCELSCLTFFIHCYLLTLHLYNTWPTYDMLKLLLTLTTNSLRK